MKRSLVCAAVASGLVLGSPQPVWAGLEPAAEEAPGPESDSAETAQPEPTPLERAEDLYDRGRAKFETVDYLGAIELWTEAFAMVADSPEAGGIKAALTYNIATAQERAFNIDHDVTHLRQAVELMMSYQKAIPTLFGEGAEAQAEREKIQSRIDALQARIEEVEAADGPQTPTPTPPPAEETLEDAPVTDPTARPLIISGAVLTAVGIAGLGVMAGGLSMGNRANDLSGLSPTDFDGRQERFQRGERGNTLAYVGGIGGGVLLATGAVLLGLGIKRKRSSSVAVAPWGGPSVAGATLRGRF